MNQFSTSAVWIGGSDSQNEGSWIWDGDNDNNGVLFWIGGPNGSSVNGAYTNWGTNPAEPDNNVGGQDKLTLTIDSGHPNYGKWNDLTSNNSNLIYYLIEYNTILSVEESIWKDEIRVYPNPFSEFIFVENTSPFEISKIEVFNNVGQRILGIKGTQNNDMKIDLSVAESGIYHLHLLLENGSQVRYKIIR